jgi:hypothetical protein
MSIGTNTGKKTSWQLAVVTAATLLSYSLPAVSRAHDKAWREHSAAKHHKIGLRATVHTQSLVSSNRFC